MGQSMEHPSACTAASPAPRYWGQESWGRVQMDPSARRGLWTRERLGKGQQSCPQPLCLKG